MTVGPGDEIAAAGGRGGRDLRASHADREQAIEALKDAFARGWLTTDELGARAGRALSARTCAELVALTADIPAGAEPARPVAPARPRPLARAAAKSGGCAAIAAAAMWVASVADPDGPNNRIPFLAGPMVILATIAVITALVIVGRGVAASVKQRRSRGQLPPPPGPGGRALEAGLRGGTSHDPVPPGPRTDQSRADLRTHISRPHRSPSSGRGARVTHGIRPVQDAM